MMSTEPAANDTSVKKSVTVRAPIEHAFKVFTERFDLWWPRDHHIGKAEMQTAILEPKSGGRWYERGVDGSECEWGRVLAYEAPKRVVLSWHLDPTWSYDPEPSRASRVEVTFQDLGDGRTRVELVHSELQRHGDGWQRIREGIASPGGWPGILERYVASAEAS